MKIAKNIKRLRALKKFTLQELADKLDIPKQRLASYEQARAEPPAQMMVKFCDYFHLTLDAFIRMDLSRLDDLSLDELGSGNHKEIDGKNLRILQSTVDNSGRENIEVVPIKSKAGYTAGYSDPEFIGSLPTFQLPFLLKDKKYRSFQLDGDSMLPIPDKSYVVGEYVQDLRSFHDGHAYIIVTLDEGVVFKVVYNQIKKRKNLLLRSLNPAYKPYEIGIEKVVEAWKFTNYFTSQIPDYYGELANLKTEFRSMAEKLEKLAL
ncbi:MAG TPA: LexA family transcriptional regulator [Bacteroidia bacterium]|jgi:transcriptional regulator with XRE-family HTH domain|nr:LexA family transcriptional regulator [Bacteroidia bacterium]